MPAWSKYAPRNYDPPPIPPPPIAPREVAVVAVLSEAPRLGVGSEHRLPARPGREDKPFRLVLGEPGPALYHQGDCPVLATELHHARLCTNDTPRIALFALDAARRRGIACPVCLFGLAKARAEHRRLKPCRVRGSETIDNGLLLRWRRDAVGAWQGLVLRQSDDAVSCEIVASSDLESMPE